MAGTFYAFSTFIMKALRRVPAAEGITAMQSINAAVINPWFLSVFIGTAIVSTIVAGLAAWDWQSRSLPMLGGGAAYTVGTFLVTVVGNIPLNNELARISAKDAAAAAVWSRYLIRWTRWNHVRTAFALVATASFMIGLMATMK